MILIRKRDIAQRQARFHMLTLQGALHLTCNPIANRSLDWDLVHEWGRIGCPGAVEVTTYQSDRDAIAAARRYERVKRRKGYR